MAEEEYLTLTWEEFEAWIRKTIGGEFRWKIRPQDNASNREMVAAIHAELAQLHAPSGVQQTGSR